MQLSFWIWLAVALLGGALSLFGWRRAPEAAQRPSRVFEAAGTVESAAAPPQRDWETFAVLLGPLLWGTAGLVLAFLPAGSTGNFSFDTHRALWWSWTAGLFCGALVRGAARFWAPHHGGAALLGLSAVGAALALFAGVEAARGARIEALLGLASGWILAREDDDAPVMGVAAVLASLALLRDVRAAGDTWTLTASVATLTLLCLMAGTQFAARWRGFWMAGALGAGALALQSKGESAAALIVLGGAFCGLILAWHARQNAASAEENRFPLLATLALALGANTVMQGYGVALGALSAGATLWALGERVLLSRVTSLGAILALYRILEARQPELRAAPFGDFTSLWALGATATLVLMATSFAGATQWKPLWTPAVVWMGLAALLVLWGERAVAGVVAGCLAAVIFGSNLAARGAVLGALWLGVWVSLGLELSETSRTTRIGALLVLAILGALGAAFCRPKMERDAP
ncbi:MAG: hypothetical protein KY445_04840 [Armatimonadetes bacterium]|nr:hypothetical protein [Armatimonadota bacterium]